MTKKGELLFRGLSALFAFLCALVFGAYTIASGGDYKSVVDNILVSGGVAGSTEASAYAFNSDYQNTTEMLTARRDLATRLTAEGSVLLKNENGALPLRAAGSQDRVNVTLLGSAAYTYNTSGGLRDAELAVYGGITGSPIYQQTVTTSDGAIQLPVTLERALEARNIQINPTAQAAYNGKNFPNLVNGSEANGSQGGPFSINEPSMTLSECGDYESYSDAAIVFLFRSSGEGREYFPGQNGLASNDGATCALGLSNSERNLIDVAGQISDNVVVLLCSAVAMEVDELKNDEDVDAVMWIGLPGSYGMDGVAQLLAGELSPSGKLPDTYAVAASNSPAAQNFGVEAANGTPIAWQNQSSYNQIAWRANSEHYVVLAEGLYTGYRYYETRYADAVYGRGDASSSVGSSSGGAWRYENEVAYTFGYGLTYSEFTEEIVPGSLTVDLENKTVSVQVMVDNVGDYTAQHVVQLYVQSPYTQYDIEHGVEKSAVQLLTYEKVELAPDDEPVIVTLTGDLKYIASYDKTVSHDNVTGGYILESGVYYFGIGNGAHEALNNIIALEGNAVNEDFIYSEEGASINENGAIAWNTADAESWAADTNGVNSSLIARTNEDGNIVQNQMENADYNYYRADTVTYLTRNDWSGTWPRTYTDLTVTDAMVDHLNNDVYKFQTGSSDVVFGYDHTLDVDENGEPLENMNVAEMKLKAFDDEDWDYLLDQVTFYEAWFLSPYGGTENEAIVSVNSPVAWQIDGPNGNVSRSIGSKAKTAGPYAVTSSDPNYGYMSSDMPCEPTVAATFNRELVEEQGKMYGEDMIWSGNAMIWAPGMNLHRTPFNSRNHEYYSEDSMLTNLTGRAFVYGGLQKGAILAAKHFAFNTQESYREGLSQFMEEQSARELELRGFQGIVEDAVYVNSAGNEVTALGMMTSFSRVGVTGVNAHTGVMKNILRGEWQFKGLSSSDMVVTGEFFTVEDAVVNNVTFMASTGPQSLLSNYWTEYNDQNKVASDPVMCQALRDNMHFYLYALANSSALNGIDPDFVVDTGMSWWQPVVIAIGCVFGVLAAGGAAASVFMHFRKDKAAGQPTENAEGGEAV